MKLLAVIGNCQVAPIAAVLRLAMPGIEVTSHVINGVNSAGKAKAIWEDVEGSDAIVSQPLNASFGALSTQRLSENHPSVTFVPNIYYQGLHPDLTYLGVRGSRITGPMGDYHSIVAVHGHLQGLIPQKINEEYDSILASLVDVSELARTSAAELIARCDAISFPGQRLLDVGKSSGVFMLSVNHPTTPMIVELAKVIVERLDTVSDPVDWKWVQAVAYNSLLKDAAWPVPAAAAQFAGLDCATRLFRNQKGKVFTRAEFITASLAEYDLLDPNTLVPRRNDLLLSDRGLVRVSSSDPTPRLSDSSSVSNSLDLLCDQAGNGLLQVGAEELQGVEWVSVEVSGRRVWSVETRACAGGVVKIPMAMATQLNRLDARESAWLVDALGNRWRIQNDVPAGPRDSVRVDSIVPVGKLGERRGTFAELTQSSRRAIVESMSGTIREIEEITGGPAFPVYGTLLGAVREQRLIDHDNDLDVGFLVEGDVIDVYRTVQAVADGLESNGYTLVRHSAGIIKASRVVNGVGPLGIDLFPFHWNGEWSRMWLELGSRFASHPVTPMKASTLEGVRLHIPRLSEEILAAIYGPDWRVPNPGFSYRGRRPATTRRYFASLFPDRLRRTRARKWDAWQRDDNEGSTDQRPIPDSDTVLLGVAPSRAANIVKSGHRVAGLDLSMRTVGAARKAVLQLGGYEGLLQQGNFANPSTLFKLIADARLSGGVSPLRIEIGRSAQFLGEQDQQDLAWILSLCLRGTDRILITSLQAEIRVGLPERPRAGAAASLAGLLKQAGFVEDEHEPELTLRHGMVRLKERIVGDG